MMFNIENWFWIVGGDQSKVWSSVRVALVPVDDSQYFAFLAHGGGATSSGLRSARASL
jgi:hypothetical protein